MTSLVALLVPIVLAAVLVFIASSVIHMLIPWHKGDYPPMPREQEFRDAVRPLAVPPGDYMLPRAQSMEEMKSDAFAAKRREGPNMILTVIPNGDRGMGRELSLWFVWLLVIAFMVAYVASRTLAPGTEYLQVMRVVATTAFLAMGGALWQMSIWYRRSWRVTITSTVDALIYGLLMGGVFGWLWPQ